MAHENYEKLSEKREARKYYFSLNELFLPTALVDPGNITIPFCDDPEVVGRGAAYGE